MELKTSFTRGELEGEDEAGEGRLRGALGHIARSLLGACETEYEAALEDESEDEVEGGPVSARLARRARNIAGSLLGEG